ncbi:MAG: hypothetical protein IBX62_08930, partial [Coriobacteriia bacterium]|nr:hypothetical protein [Coriobacteriia bacterium]
MTTVPARRLVTAALASVLTLALAMPLSVATPPARASAAPVTTADLRAVAFADASVGYAVGTGGTIVRTVDGGATWAVTRSGGGYDLRGVSAKAGKVWAVSQSGALIRKTDPGWEVRHENIGDPFYLPDLHDVDIISAGAGMAFGGLADTDEAPVAFSSFDGGEQWPFNLVYKAREYSTDPEQPDAKEVGLGKFYAADFVSADLGWAVGSDEFKELFGDKTQHDDGIVYNYDTSRGYGENAWLKQASFAGTGPLYGVSFGSTAWGIAVGAGGRAYYTTDGGTTWTQGNTGVTSALRAVATAGPPSSEAWAVGDVGVILRTSDGGQNWTQLMNPTGAVALRGVAAAGGTTAVAVGASGTILRTTNGSDWYEVGVPPSVTDLTSSTHPVPSTWYPSRDVSFSWTAGGGATQYSYVFDKNTSTVPDDDPETSGTSADVTANSDGVWYFHVKAGNGSVWGETAHRTVRIDATKPALTHDAASAYTSSASITLTAA